MTSMTTCNTPRCSMRSLISSCAVLLCLAHSAAAQTVDCPNTVMHCNNPSSYNNNIENTLACDEVTCEWDLSMLDSSGPPQICIDDNVQLVSAAQARTVEDKHEPCALWEFQFGALASTTQGGDDEFFRAVTCGDFRNEECAQKGPPPTSFQEDDKYGVRCCSEVNVSLFRRRSGCNVYVASHGLGGPDTTETGEGCAKEATYQQAELYCAMAGGRLCSKDEMRCTSGSGCQLNKELNWVKMAATEQPTKAPTTLAPVVTPAPVTNSPTEGVVQEPPTRAPSATPTLSPVTKIPTLSPVSKTPTSAPIVVQAPTSQAPTPSPSIAPTQSPVESVKETTNPTQSPVEAVKETTAPTLSPVEAVKETTTPTQSPVESVKETTVPTQSPVEAVEDTTTPTKSPEQLITDTTTPTKSPQETVTETTAPTPVSATSPAPTVLDKDPKSVEENPAASPVSSPVSDNTGDDGDNNEGEWAPQGVLIEVEEFQITMYMKASQRRLALRKLSSLSVESQAVLHLLTQQHILKHVPSVQVVDMVVATDREVALADGSMAIVETIGGRVMLYNGSKGASITLDDLNESIQTSFEGSKLHDFLIVLLNSPDEALRRVFDMEPGVPAGLDIFANGQVQNDSNEEGSFGHLAILAVITLLFLFAFIFLLFIARRAANRKSMLAKPSNEPPTPSSYNTGASSEGGVPENIDGGAHNENNTISELAISEYGFGVNDSRDNDGMTLYSYRTHQSAAMSNPINNDTGSFAASYFYQPNHGENSSQSSGMWSIFDGVMSVDGSLKQQHLNPAGKENRRIEGYSVPKSIMDKDTNKRSMPPRAPSSKNGPSKDDNGKEKAKSAIASSLIKHSSSAQRSISPMTMGSLVQELGSLVQDGATYPIVDCDSSVSTPPVRADDQSVTSQGNLVDGHVPESLMGQLDGPTNGEKDDDDDAVSFSRPATELAPTGILTAPVANVVSDEEEEKGNNKDDSEDEFADEEAQSVDSSKYTQMSKHTCVLIEDVSEDDITLTGNMAII